ncbi:MAG: C45 family peptidase [Planctomycetota bacterium]
MNARAFQILWIALILIGVQATPGHAQPATSSAMSSRPVYLPAKTKGGELTIIETIPVLKVSGTPEQIGAQIGELGARNARELYGYPKDFLDQFGSRYASAFAWPMMMSWARDMLPMFPEHHLREMNACAEASGFDREVFVAANTMFDIKKMVACSTLYVSGERSETGGPMLGRNLDFPTLGYLQKYSMVSIVEQPGKHTFASVGFPGLIGVLSGMNDAGLALAVLEVYSSKDGSPKFEKSGTPYALCFRRLLEECTTVDEALKTLREMKRTTYVNLAIADRTTGAVFEITPKQVVRREPEDGLLSCTNHFRTEELGTRLQRGGRRYRALEEARSRAKLGTEAVWDRLDAANAGSLTLQSMIFEPKTLRLHLAFGECPSTQQPRRTIELKPLFE